MITPKKAAITNMASILSGWDLDRILPLVVICVDELVEDDNLETREYQGCPSCST